MENVIFVALLLYCLMITAGTDGQIARNIEIENCNEGFIDIQEHANKTLLCKGFNERDTIVWTFRRDDENKPRAVATCYASFNCTVHQSDHFAVERSPSNSTLFYHQYDRQVDTLATVACRSQFGTSQLFMECNLNVINPAELSNCTLEEDRDRETVTGRCRFDGAFSYRRGFQCTWYQETDGQSTRFIGNIEYDSGSQSPSGWCTFTVSWEPGTYTYSINFYPGPGKITVNVENTATRSPDLSSPTYNFEYTSPETLEENDLSVGAIVGGIVAVVVIIIVVVVVVVFVRKKRKQKPAGSAHGSGNDNATDNYENTYEVPAHRPPNAEPEHVYNDSNTATTTSTTTPSHSITTTTGDLHNTTTNQHREQGKTLDNVHHNPVYVNENQPGEESLGMQQHPTYANDLPAQGNADANRDSNPYYSEIKDTGIN